MQQPLQQVQSLLHSAVNLIQKEVGGIWSKTGYTNRVHWKLDTNGSLRVKTSSNLNHWWFLQHATMHGWSGMWLNILIKENCMKILRTLRGNVGQLKLKTRWCIASVPFGMTYNFPDLHRNIEPLRPYCTTLIIYTKIQIYGHLNVNMIMQWTYKHCFKNVMYLELLHN